MRLTGIPTGNAMEAALGARFGKKTLVVSPPSRDSSGERLSNIVVMTFAARRADGRLMPAYARYIAVTGNNFLWNA